MNKTAQTIRNFLDEHGLSTANALNIWLGIPDDGTTPSDLYDFCHELRRIAATGAIKITGNGDSPEEMQVSK